MGEERKRGDRRRPETDNCKKKRLLTLLSTKAGHIFLSSVQLAVKSLMIMIMVTREQKTKMQGNNAIEITERKETQEREAEKP